jgi:periplasmic protein TonB
MRQEVFEAIRPWVLRFETREVAAKFYREEGKRLPLDRLAGLAFVLALHAAALYGLWQHRLIPSPLEAATLFVNFIAPPTPEKKEEPKRLPPKPVEKPQPRRLVAETPVVAPTDYVAPLPPEKPAPEPVIQAPPIPLPVGPVALSAELAVTCPERSAPSYPAQSRRLGEEGSVVLRVELDESGRVASTQVKSSSGHARLDEAALAAVRTWRCTPATRNGQPVRAVALQPFKFVLQGN